MPGEGGGGNSGFSLVPMREQGFWKTPLNAYIAMEKYTLNAYIIFFKNIPFYAFLGICSTKVPLLTRFCLHKCVHEYWQTKLNIYIHFWHLRSNKRPVIKKKTIWNSLFLMQCQNIFLDVKWIYQSVSYHERVNTRMRWYRCGPPVTPSS